MITFITFILVFGVIIFVHEFGHFFVAKRSGVKVEEFGFGFPPRIWAKKIGETEYSINAIPLGGFVRVLGEDDRESKDPRSIANQSFFRRISFFSAGVVMNYFLAIIILSLAYAVGVKSLIPGMWEHNFVQNTQKVKVVAVDSDSPAARAGILPEDKIIAVDEKRVYMDMEFIGEIAYRPGEELDFKVERDNKTADLKVTPNNNTDLGRATIGIEITTDGKVSAPWYLSPVVAFSEALRLAKLTFLGIIQFFSRFLTSLTVSEGVVGPVGIYVASGEFAKMGIGYLLQFMAVLTVGLAVLNIMPIPVLDGGYLTLAIIEKIRGKKIAQKTKRILQYAGLAVLLLLIVTITFKDVIRFGIIDGIKRLFRG